jgi:hypothetical protein
MDGREMTARGRDCIYASDFPKANFREHFDPRFAPKPVPLDIVTYRIVTWRGVVLAWRFPRDRFVVYEECDLDWAINLRFVEREPVEIERHAAIAEGLPSSIANDEMEQRAHDWRNFVQCDPMPGRRW